MPALWKNAMAASRSARELIPEAEQRKAILAGRIHIAIYVATWLVDRLGHGCADADRLPRCMAAGIW